jgi:hypothetical protein
MSHWLTHRGYLYYDKVKNRYLIGILEKIADPGLSGNMIAYDILNCTLSGEAGLIMGDSFDF